MSNTNLQRIKQTLQRLKNEKEQVNQQFYAERENLSNFEREMEDLRSQSDYLMNVIQEKEDAINEFNRMIQESEKAYTTLVDNSNKLLQAIDSEATNLRSRMKPGAKDDKNKKEDEPDEGEEEEGEGDDEDGDDED